MTPAFRAGLEVRAPGEGRSLSLQLRLFHERIAEHVQNAHLGIFDPPIVGIVDGDDVLGNLGHGAAPGADQRHGLESLLPRPAQRREKIFKLF